MNVICMFAVNYLKTHTNKLYSKHGIVFNIHCWLSMRFVWATKSSSRFVGFCCVFYHTPTVSKLVSWFDGCWFFPHITYATNTKQHGSFPSLLLSHLFILYCSGLGFCIFLFLFYFVSWSCIICLWPAHHIHDFVRFIQSITKKCFVYIRSYYQFPTNLVHMHTHWFNWRE